MKVTDEMIDLYGKVWHETPEGEAGTRRRAALQAVLDLIDPVPEGVNVIVDREGDEWQRVGAMSWYYDMTQIGRATWDVIAEFGPITWEGKDA